MGIGRNCQSTGYPWTWCIACVFIVYDYYILLEIAYESMVILLYRNCASSFWLDVAFGALMCTCGAIAGALMVVVPRHRRRAVPLSPVIFWRSVFGGK